MVRLSLCASVVVAAVVAAAVAASPDRRDRIGAVEYLVTPGNDEALDRLYVEERLLEALERIAGQLEASAAAKGPTDRDTLRLLMRLVRVSHASKERLIADGLLAPLTRLAQAHLRDDDPLLLETYLRGAVVAHVSRRTDEARNLLASARAIGVRSASLSPIARDHLDGVQSTIEGRRDAASRVKAAEVGLEAYARYGVSPSLPEAAGRTWRAVFLDRAGRSGEVPAAIRDARRTLSDLAVPSGWYATILTELEAERLIRLGRWEEAVPLIERVTRDAAINRDRSMVGVFSRRGTLGGYDLLALDAVRHGRGEEAWRHLERHRAPHHVDMLTIGKWRRLDPAGWDAYRSAQDRLLDARDRASSASSAGSCAWDEPNWRTTTHWVKTRLQVLRMENEYLRRFVPRDVSIEAARKALGPHDALVGWLEVNLGGDPGPDSQPHAMHHWVYVLRPDRPIAWVPVFRGATPDEVAQDIPRTGSGLVTVLRAARWPSPVEDDPELRGRLRRWSESYFDPALPHLEGVERIVFAETRFPVGLHVLPDGRYVGERFDVAVVPSGQALALGLEAERPSQDAPRRSSAVVITASASPTPSLPAARRGTRTLRDAFQRVDDAAAGSPDLPFAAREAQDVSALFDESSVFSGTAESLRRLDGMVRGGGLERVGIVHIAAHAVSAREPEACAFTLTGARSGRAVRGDGLLDAEEMFRGWRLSADLVTLSGCDSSTAAGIGEREWYGFVPIASAIGANRVLGSLWPVDDRATSILMKRFYENYTGRYDGRRGGAPAGPMKPERALREAQAYVRGYREGGKKPYAHPAYWASFELVQLHGSRSKKAAP